MRRSKTRSASASLSLLALHATVSTAYVLPHLRPATPPRAHVSATFSSESDYLDEIEKIELPGGFRVGVSGFEFKPAELEGKANAVMNMTLIALDAPTEDYAAVMTRNRFPGAPIKVIRERLFNQNPVQAVIVNNKISNVCAAGDGVDASERVCAAVASTLGIPGGREAVLPLSTGVIGWRLPIKQMVDAVPDLLKALTSGGSALPAAKSIMTTDRFPKLRMVEACGGRIVGFAKGAGMIEPDMATMLAFCLTDVAVPRDALQPMLKRAADVSFNCASVDADQSTSDALLCLSSGLKKVKAGSSEGGRAQLEEFEQALTELCVALSEDVVRNGEGTTHVIRCKVVGAPTFELARGVGKAVINSPLFKAAVAGNDPNVGRLVSTVGSYLGRAAPELDLKECSMKMGGKLIFSGGEFKIDLKVEDELYEHMKDALLCGEYGASLPYPPHERCVEIEVDLGDAETGESCTVHGSDLTKEYVSINADYRS